jgi:hypothetical protein
MFLFSMSKKLSGLVYIIIIIAFCPSFAAAVSVTATVDKTEATIEDTISLTVSVEGSRNSDDPKLPPKLTEHFSVTSQGSASRIHIVNNQITSGIDYTYLLYPRHAGRFTIGPVTVEAKGKTFRSQPFTVRITPASTGIAKTRDIFITSEVDNLQPYEYQQIVYTFRFFRSIKVVNARLLEDLNFQGFFIEKLGKEKEYTVTRDGKKYLVTEFKQALFPTQPGALSIPALRLQADVVHRSKRRSFLNDPLFDDSFFSRSKTTTKVLTTSKLDLNVRPLPECTNQQSFNNLVGDFTVSTALQKDTLQVGDSATLTITIAGSGNIWDAVEPEISGLPQAKLYSDKPAVSTSIRDGRVGGEITFKKAIVPLEAGTFTIPPFKVGFFDPQQERYEYFQSKPYALTVTPSSEKEDLKALKLGATPPAKQAVTMVGDDIFPLHISFKALQHQTLKAFSLSYCVFFILPIFAYVTGWAIKIRLDKLSNNSGLIRSQRALKAFGKNLKKSQAHLEAGSSAEFCRLAARFFKNYLGDKLNLTGNALTAQEAVEKLSSRKIDSQLTHQVEDLLDHLERAQFASATQTVRSREELLEKMQALAKQLEKNLR